jgi:hypothetical protein
MSSCSSFSSYIFLLLDIFVVVLSCFVFPASIDPIDRFSLMQKITLATSIIAADPAAAAGVSLS